jgi:hypothetical protein
MTRSPPRLELRGAFRVALLLGVVDAAVQLDAELYFGAEEIEYEPVERMLPAELEPVHGAVAQHAPQHPLRLRLLLRPCAHRARRLSLYSVLPHVCLRPEGG